LCDVRVIGLSRSTLIPMVLPNYDWLSSSLVVAVLSVNPN